MTIDIEGVSLEAAMWKPTHRLRWFRPPRGDDNDLVLQQLWEWERLTGECEWRLVDTVLAD